MSGCVGIVGTGGFRSAGRFLGLAQSRDADFEASNCVCGEVEAIHLPNGRGDFGSPLQVANLHQMSGSDTRRKCEAHFGRFLASGRSGDSCLRRNDLEGGFAGWIRGAGWERRFLLAQE